MTSLYTVVVFIILCSRMDLLNRALEQVIDQLVTQKISNLKLEIENQKQTILGMVLFSGINCLYLQWNRKGLGDYTVSGPHNYKMYNWMLISIGHVIGCIFNSLELSIILNLCQICHFELKNVKMKSEKNLMIYKDRTDCLWRKYC